METRPNGADLLGDWLDGHRRWPCQNPSCHRRVDPDSPDQYCSRTCRNRCLAGKENRDKYHKWVARTSGGWRPQPIDIGLWPRGR